MAGLQHSFVHGIRFDTDVEYRVQGRRGSRYRLLPLQLPVRFAASRAGDGGLLSAMQCVSLVCQKPFNQVLQWFAAQDLTEIDTVALVTGLRWDGKRVQFDVLPNSLAKSIGALSLQSILGGLPYMVQFASRHGSRWATVIGVEWQARDDAQDGGRGGNGGGRARTLLLLDPQASAPWACGHNARLELWHQRERTSGAGVGVHATAKLRHLSGEVWTVQIQQLIRVGLSLP